MALPSPATTGRLLLLLKSISEVTETSSAKRAKKKSGYDVGALVQAEVGKLKHLVNISFLDIVLMFLTALDYGEPVFFCSSC